MRPTAAIPDKKTLRDIICKFFHEDWPQVEADQLKVSHVSDGYNSLILIVDRGVVSPDSEPGKVVVRLPKTKNSSGTEEPDIMKAGQLEEVLTCAAFASKGWGAQVYGVFAVGRVDEYIPGTCLTQELAADASIRREVAKSYARFHSLTLPCDKSRFTVFNETMLQLFDSCKGSEEMIQFGDDVSLDLRPVFDYDYASGMRKILRRLHEIRAKKCWCVIDPQFGNVIIRDPDSVVMGQSRIVLIDFEFTTFHYRAFDIGGHFLEKAIIRKDNIMDEKLFYTLEEQQDFCFDYLREAGKHDHREQESVEQLMQEARLGMLLRLLFNMFCMFRHVIRFGKEMPFTAESWREIQWEHQFLVKQLREVSQNETN